MKAMHKRILVLLAAVMLLACMLGVSALAAQNDPADEPVCYEHGDMNSDGVVTGEDAIYLLYASFGDLFGNEFLLGQDGDLDGNGVVTGEDAVYLLYASFDGMFEDQYPLKGTVHNYFDPIWTWDTEGAEPTVSVSLKCACGQPHTITEGITVTAGTVTDATCVAAGSKEYTATVTYEGKDYENTLTVSLPALGENGHDIQGQPTCTQGVKCANCDYEEPALGHSYVASEEKVEDCKHTLMQKCACGAEQEGEVYYTHTYTASLTKEATCSANGEQTLKCACGDVQTEAIPANEAFHDWNEGVVDGGVTTYTCKHNASHTKTVVEMSAEGVSAEALKENEVQLDGGAAVSLGENALQNVAEDASVVIEVNQVSKNELSLDADKLEQIGDATVYDFSMTVGGQEVSEFGGKITVSLPYTLQDGDDVNNIDVWFIDDDGTITSCLGVYNNGFVTFETEHFSYYTVTRMTPAERCERYGHNMVERTKDATCTEDGYHKIFCLRCGVEEKNEVEEMLGHDYKKDADQSVDATCDAPGKLVSICANCDHKRIQEVKQLSHDWAVETVAPTCSAKGYDLYTCELCDAEKRFNEKEALGHKYLEADAQWNWNDDCTKASVTLVCANDGTHTKELAAVVTSKGGNACVGGTATYTATASYNKITYTATVTGELNGVGHTPDTEWAGDDDKHYHTCTVCGEPVGKADHEWDRKVVKAATCEEDGSAIDTCSVCGKEKTVVLSATGKHIFVGGVCTSCGYKDGDCDHKKLTVITYDLTEMGCCGGEVSVRTCACGAVSEWYGLDYDCEDVDETSDRGDTYIKYTLSCPKCGLYAEGEQKIVVDETKCIGSYQLNYLVKMGDTLVAKTSQEAGQVQHPATVKHTPINTANYGLCAGTLTKTTCPCGLCVEWDSEDGCDMKMGQDENSFYCTTCGATGTSTFEQVKQGCVTMEKVRATYKKNGVVVLTMDACYVEVTHSYTVVEHTMLGKTCEDGVIIKRVCSACGDVNEYTTYGCSTILVEKTIDTSASNSCSTAIEIRTCACGDYKNWRYVYGGEAEDHRWTYEWDPETGTEYEYCSVCGFSLTSDTSRADPSTKDDNCRVYYTRTYTYSNGEGQEYTWEIRDWSTYHNMEYAVELQGDTCEDGVKIHESCVDCGMDETWTTDYHYHYPIEELDLSQYGFCSGGVYVYGCACGEYAEINFGDDACYWEGIAGDEGFEERICIECGIVWQQRWERIETDDPCVVFYQYEHTFLKDGQELGKLTSHEKYYNHRYVYELALEEGAETCADGYTVCGTCLECGKTFESWDRGCSSYEVARERIDGMCGQAELVTERCACGKYSGKDVVWYGEESCDFYSGDDIYNEEFGVRQYFCAGCGCSRIRVNETLPVPGETCEYESRTTQYYFNSDGMEICRAVYSGYGQSHDWLHETELLGDTCDDGWTYTLICADCGTTRTSSGVDYGCSKLVREREVIYSAEDICGDVILYRRSCACGELADYSLSTQCRIDHWQNDTGTCGKCGMQRTQVSETEKTYGSCLQQQTYNYTFLRDGVQVASVSYTNQVRQHAYLYELILLGESCEDGYRVVEKCAYCDYEESWDDVINEHNSYCVERYDMPEAACGGYAYVYACACGQVRYVECYLGYCDLVYQEQTSDEDGHIYQTAVCRECGLTETLERYDTPGKDDCHTVNNHTFSWSMGEWYLELSGFHIENNHRWVDVSTELKEDSENCEDGIWVNRVCSVCGETGRYTNYSHTMMPVEGQSIDLEPYGAVCGAKLELRACACGYMQGYEFSNDTECDMGYNYIEHWIEGVRDNSYYTTEGSQNVSSNAYLRYCAVTDPQCNLKIRMARYWLNNNCVASEYETWQLGYDPETGTCQREITIATGRSQTYHPYTYTTENSTEGDLTCNSRVSLCPDCGSSYIEKCYYDEAMNLLKEVDEAINLKKNGENLRYTRTWEYEVTECADGNIASRQTLYRNETVYADGSGYWYQNAYTYGEDCKAIRTYTNSDGDNESYDYGYSHYTSSKDEWITEPTCTQDGHYVRIWTCRICGKETNREEYTRTPYDHYWIWDSEKQVYSCYECGLENTNGISGSIWMEDMSNETYYIVGYYDCYEIGFIPYVSLILYDVAEDAEDQIVLETLQVEFLAEETDGVRGLRISKAEVAAAAAEALKDYTGSYAVRISCVPRNGDTTKDYAVTFDTLIAE